MADVAIHTTVNIGSETQAQRGIVWTSTTTGYAFFTDNVNDALYRKTTDSGATWAAAVTVKTGTVEALEIWYDKWTPGLSTGLIHIAYIDSGVDDVLYRNLDTSSDTLSSEVAVLSGATATPLNGCRVGVTRARGGNIYVYGDMDGTGGENVFGRSTDAGVSFSARTTAAEGASGDQALLVPANTSDTQDIAILFWDWSANEISVKMYDDSANTHTETSISTGMVELALGSGQPQWAATVRHSDNHVLFAAWNDTNSVTADLMTWDLTLDSIAAPTITAKTNISTNTDGITGIGLCINQNSNRVYACHFGNLDSSEAPGTSVGIYYVTSDDGMATWSGDNAMSETSRDYRTLATDLGGTESRFQPIFYDDDLDDLFTNAVNGVTITATTTAVKDPIGGLGIIAFPR